jgi:hypothetical protein
MDRKIAACTIAGRNAVAHARVTANSFRERHPDLPFFTLLSDDPDGLFDPAAEPFAAVTLAELAVPNVERLRFVYPQPDLSYALTPWFLGHLLGRGFRSVLFLKQETLVVGSLTSLFDRLDGAAILLTPHLVDPLDRPLGGQGPPSDAAEAARREREVLLAGAFNCGVMGITEGATARRFLAWWGERLRLHALRAVEQGMHFEQRWLDFVPAYFPPVAIDRRPGSNLGHWRLPESRIEELGDAFAVDGDPLRVMRFSGFDWDRPEFLTRHHRRVPVSGMSAAGQRLVGTYTAALAGAGQATAEAWPSGSSRFADGGEIPLVARAIYRRLAESDRSRFGDPHQVGPGSFRSWLAEPLPAPWRTARVWREVWRDRPDLQAAFPHPDGADRRAFARWIDRHGGAESGLEAAGWLRPRRWWR